MWKGVITLFRKTLPLSLSLSLVPQFLIVSVSGPHDLISFLYPFNSGRHNDYLILYNHKLTIWIDYCASSEFKMVKNLKHIGGIYSVSFEVFILHIRLLKLWTSSDHQHCVTGCLRSNLSLQKEKKRLLRDLKKGEFWISFEEEFLR